MEFKKVIIYKKIFAGIAFLCILQLLFFAYINRNYVKTVHDENYTLNYSDYVGEVVKKAESMSKVSIFYKADSFSKANIEKTLKDYKKLQDVKIASFDDNFMTAHFQYKELFGFVLIAGILVVFVYKPEKEKGIKGLLYATKNGRGVMAARRLTAILLWDALIVMAFYWANLICGGIILKGNVFTCLTYPVQSMEIFKNWTATDTIGVFLLKYYVYRVFILFAISAILYMLFTIFNNEIIPLGIAAIIGGIQYGMTRLTNDNTACNILKYCNLYCLASSNTFFTRYKNINVFNKAVSKNVMMAGFVGINIAIASLTGILVSHCKRTYVKGLKINILGKTIGNIRNSVQLKIPETYKIMWIEKGLIILAVLVFVVIRSTYFGVNEKNRAKDMYFAFMDKYEGVPGYDSAKEIDDLRNTLDEVDAQYQRVEEDHSKGLVSDSEYINMQIVMQTYMKDKMFLQEIESQTDYLKENTKNGWYVNKYKYGRLFKNDNTMVNLVTFVTVVLLCSGIFYYERKKGMNGLLRQCVEGREKLFNKKMRYAILTASAVGIFEIILEVSSAIHGYGAIVMKAPVQSLETFWFVKWNCSIGMFYIFICLMRIAITVMIAMVAASLSVITSQTISFMFAFILCIPSLLYLIGINFMEKLSIIDVMSVSPYMVRHGSVNAIIYAMVFLAAATASVYHIAYRKWCK